MATAEYLVYVKNKSGESQDYLFFNKAPEAYSTVGTLYNNVWIKSQGVASPHGTGTFDVKVANFAICGITPKPVDNGVVVATSDFAPVELTTKDKKGTAPVLAIVDDGPQFTPPYETTTKVNSFGIHTKPFESGRYPTVYCGYGKANDAGDVVPVAVWQAKGEQKYDLTPKVTYYVGTGSYSEGTAVDITDLGAIATIDFTTAKPGQTIATVTHKDDGSYSDPEFDYPKKLKPDA